MRVSEALQSIPQLESANYGSSGSDLTSFHIGRLLSVSVYIIFGSLTGNSVLTVNTGATRGTKTTAIAFKYRIPSGAWNAASGDVLGDPQAVTSAGLTLTAATFQHKFIVVEIDADNGTDGQPWVTVNIDPTATTMNAAALALAYPRYPGHTDVTAVR